MESGLYKKGDDYRELAREVRKFVKEVGEETKQPSSEELLKKRADLMAKLKDNKGYQKYCKEYHSS